MLVTSLSIVLLLKQTPQALGNATVLQIRTSTTDGFATSTPNYFGVGGTRTATTTLLTINNLDNADSFALDILMNASTTGSVINWIYEFSPDNGITWFGAEDEGLGTTNPQAVTHTASSTIHSWTPLAAGLATKHTAPERIFGRSMRVRFWGDTASSSIWVAASIKQQRD